MLKRTLVALFALAFFGVTSLAACQSGTATLTSGTRYYWFSATESNMLAPSVGPNTVAYLANPGFTVFFACTHNYSPPSTWHNYVPWIKYDNLHWNAPNATVTPYGLTADVGGTGAVGGPPGNCSATPPRLAPGGVIAVDPERWPKTPTCEWSSTSLSILQCNSNCTPTVHCMLTPVQWSNTATYGQGYVQCGDPTTIPPTTSDCSVIDSSIYYCKDSPNCPVGDDPSTDNGTNWTLQSPTPTTIENTLITGCNLAHSAGYLCACQPGFDSYAGIINLNGYPNKLAAFAASGIVAATASVGQCDIWNFQTQFQQDVLAGPYSFQYYVYVLVQQAVAVNPFIITTVGYNTTTLATCTPTPGCQSAQIAAAMNQDPYLSNGSWLNLTQGQDAIFDGVWPLLSPQGI